MNDYRPQFIVDELKLNFTEHRSPGLEKRLIVSTVDVDEVGEFYSDVIDPTRTSEETIRQQTGVCYFIVGGDDTSSSFVLHPTLHQLQVVKELDRENKSRSGHQLNSLIFFHPVTYSDWKASVLFNPKEAFLIAEG